MTTLKLAEHKDGARTCDAAGQWFDVTPEYLRANGAKTWCHECGAVVPLVPTRKAK